VEVCRVQGVRQNKSEGRGANTAKGAADLNEARVEASFMIWHMLGYVDCSAAILTADRHALQHSYANQNCGREPSGCRVGGQHPNSSGRPTHDNQRHQKGIFAADQIAYTTEEQRTEGTDDEDYRECRQVGQVSEGRVPRRVELQGEDDG